MDEAAELYRTLATLGVQLGVRAGGLTASAPVGVLTGELLARIRDHRTELLRRLGEISAAGVVADAVVSDRTADHDPFPLSDLQLGFYVADDPHMEFHVRPHCYMEFDDFRHSAEVYQEAWRRALDRHRRALCVVDADARLRMIEDPEPIRIVVHDLTAMTPARAAAELDAIRASMERQELPLHRWPWIDVRMSIRREQGREVRRLHYNHNNFFVDGWGTSELLAEIESYCDPAARTRPDLDLSYRDAVLALQERATSAAGKAAEDYWRQRLPGLPLPPTVPLRDGQDRRCRAHLVRHEHRLDPARWQRFKTAAAIHGVTPSNAVICAYAHVLATFSNSDHFILSQMATRRKADLHPEMLQLLGNFVSLYPLEIRLSRELDFAANAAVIQQQVLDDMRHLAIGGMHVLQELNRLRGSFGSAPSPFVVGSGLSLKQWRRPDYTVLETCQTLLDHQFFELDDGSGWFVWDLLEEQFPDGLVEALLAAYRRLLDRLVDDDAAWSAREFRLVDRADLAVREALNAAALAPFEDRLLHDALSPVAERQPEAIAVQHPLTPISYGRLRDDSAALAARLRSLGVGPGERVAIMMDRGPDLVVAAFAVLACGAAYVPIDPGLPESRIAQLLDDVAPVVVATQHEYRGRSALPHVFVPDEAAATAPTATASGERLGRDRTAYVIYTSGSTGRPKGVMIDHRGAANTVDDINRRFGIGAGDVVFGVSAFNFDLSVYDIFGTVAAGATLVYPEPQAALDPAHWLDLLVRHAVTVWNSVPALMQLLVEAAERVGVTLPALRCVLLSGDKIPLELPERIAAVAPNARIVSLGGATEASIWSIYFPVTTVDPAWRTIPYGYPLANQSWQVLDRHGEPCPTWVPGELFIGGIGLAQGYWNDPERTRQRFVTGAFGGERLYRTGDAGRYVAGGVIEWIGRTDLQVKLHGHRIELGEIESILQTMDAVEAAVVTIAGTGATRFLVGHVRPAAGSGTDGLCDLLEDALRTRLPAYMVPTRWQLHRQWPLTANGKVDRARLASMSVTEATIRPAGPGTPPATAIERTLCAVWSEVLGIGTFGVDDDFFDLGGQSFDAIRIFGKIKASCGRTFTLGDMWSLRTVRAFARAIEHDDAPGGETVVRMNDVTDGVPLVLVHPAGGSVLAYAALARTAQRPVFAVQVIEPPVGADIRAIASAYVEAVIAALGERLVCLGGWSTGAMIAVEMAALWEARGAPLADVLVLDGPTPAELPGLSDAQLLAWYLEDLDLGLPLAGLSGLPLADLAPDAQLRSAIARLGATPRLDADDLLDSFRTFRALVVAGARHRPSVVRSDLTVVRVSEDRVSEFATHPDLAVPDWGWSRYTLGCIRSLRVPGNHHSFLREPGLAQWSDLIGAPVDPS